MKNRYLLLALIALLAFGVTSCTKFLDETPDNRTELDNDEKITQIISSAYPDNTYAIWTNLMSDDHDDIGVKDYPTMSQYEEYMVQAWNWDEIKEEGNDSPKNTWEEFYWSISNANQALQAIEDLGNPESLSAQRGEALIARAWCHFKLVNLFCQHYTEAHGDTDLGIPYMEAPETKVKPHYTRGSVKEVYEKIERDIEEALPLIDDNIYSVPKYHFNYAAAHAFAAEFFLYYKKYDRAIECANEVLGNNPEAIMRDVTVGWPDQTNMPANIDVRGIAYVDATVNANLLIKTSVSNLAVVAANYYEGKRFLHNDAICMNETLSSPSVLWNVSPPTDANRDRMFYMRMFTFTSSPRMPMRLNIPYYFEVTDPVNQTGYRRSVEVIYTVETALLVRAEANILKENYAAAMEDINLWVKKRVNPAFANANPKTEQQVEDYYGGGTNGLEYYTWDKPTPRKKMFPETPFTSNKQEAFIQAILHLRRIEFFAEGNRWFDVKRYNIEIYRRQYREPGPNEHILTLHENKVLTPRDPRMAVQLPIGVISAGMEPNPR